MYLTFYLLFYIFRGFIYLFCFLLCELKDRLRNSDDVYYEKLPLLSISSKIFLTVNRARCGGSVSTLHDIKTRTADRTGSKVVATLCVRWQETMDWGHNWCQNSWLEVTPGFLFIFTMLCLSTCVHFHAF